MRREQSAGVRAKVNSRDERLKALNRGLEELFQHGKRVPLFSDPGRQAEGLKILRYRPGEFPITVAAAIR